MRTHRKNLQVAMLLLLGSPAAEESLAAGRLRG